MSVLLILFVVLVFFFVVFCSLQSVLARRKNPKLGLVMPIFFLVISVASVVSAMEQTFVLTMQSKAPLVALLLWVLVLLVLNIPTVVTYAIYYRARRKMDEIPWPFKK